RHEQTHEGGQPVVLVAREHGHPTVQEPIEAVAGELGIAPRDGHVNVPVPHRMEPEAESRDHAEVAPAAPAQRLEQALVLGMSRPRNLVNLAARSDDLGADQAVARQTELTQSETPAASLRQSADVHVAARATRKVVAAPPQLDIYVRQRQPRANPDPPRPPFLELKRVNGGDVDEEHAVSA